MRELVLIVHNVRSCHNVGAMLRTAEGLGVSEVILTGYTPYPVTEDDARLPHLAKKIDKQIAKTSLGAEKTISWRYSEDLTAVLANLKQEGYTIAALEQAKNSTKLPDFRPPEKLALIVGNEVTGLESKILALADITLEIPMFGAKESFNVASAAAIALYHIRFMLQ